MTSNQEAGHAYLFRIITQLRRKVYVHDLQRKVILLEGTSPDLSPNEYLSKI
jgi:hypothetical protein